jgi:hypothetical protein
MIKGRSFGYPKWDASHARVQVPSPHRKLRKGFLGGHTAGDAPVTNRM